MDGEVAIDDNLKNDFGEEDDVLSENFKNNFGEDFNGNFKRKCCGML